MGNVLTGPDGIHIFIDDKGIPRRLGNIIPPAGLTRAWPVFGSVPTQKLIPRSEWPDLIGSNTDEYHPFALTDFVHDQDGIGMCNASATVAAIEAARHSAGLMHVPLSGGDLYRRISGGVDRGSLLEDGLAAAMQEGVLPVSECPYLDWRQNHQGDRARYKVLEASLCPTFDHCFSAVLQGFFLISGIMWYDSYTPDAQGWLPSTHGGGGGGHAVMGYKATMRGPNNFGIWHKNSWTAGWGYHGLCVFPEPAYRGPVGGWWAVRVPADEGGNVPAPHFNN